MKKIILLISLVLAGIYVYMFLTEGYSADAKYRDEMDEIERQRRLKEPYYDLTTIDTFRLIEANTFSSDSLKRLGFAKIEVLRIHSVRQVKLKPDKEKYEIQIFYSAIQPDINNNIKNREYFLQTVFKALFDKHRLGNKIMRFCYKICVFNTSDIRNPWVLSRNEVYNICGFKIVLTEKGYYKRIPFTNNNK